MSPDPELTQCIEIDCDACGHVNPVFVEDMQPKLDRLHAALAKIHGHFIAGERNTYAPAAETLDMIRREAAEGLGLPAPTPQEVPRA